MFKANYLDQEILKMKSWKDTKRLIYNIQIKKLFAIFEFLCIQTLQIFIITFEYYTNNLLLFLKLTN